MGKLGAAKATWEDCKPKERRFVEAYLGQAAGNHVEAARLAGFSAPGEVGRRLLRRLQQVIDSKLVNAEAQSIMSVRGVMERLSTLADKADRDSDKLKALELLARVHGLLNDKLSVQVDVVQARAALMGTMETVLTITPAQDAILSLPAPTEPASADLPRGGQEGSEIGQSTTIEPSST